MEKRPLLTRSRLPEPRTGSKEINGVLQANAWAATEKLMGWTNNSSLGNRMWNGWRIWGKMKRGCSRRQKIANGKWMDGRTARQQDRVMLAAKILQLEHPKTTTFMHSRDRGNQRCSQAPTRFRSLLLTLRIPVIRTSHMTSKKELKYRAYWSKVQIKVQYKNHTHTIFILLVNKIILNRHCWCSLPSLNLDLDFSHTEILQSLSLQGLLTYLGGLL